MNRQAGLRICLIFCFVLAALVSENCIAIHSGHECSGERCPVCLLMQGAKNFSGQFKCAALFFSAFSGALLMAVLVAQPGVSGLISLNPVRLKVKMNR